MEPHDPGAPDSTRWKKSTYSGMHGSQNCVEVAFPGGDVVAVRNSKHPDGGRLNFTRAEWEAFLRGARDGEFDG